MADAPLRQEVVLEPLPSEPVAVPPERVAGVPHGREVKTAPAAGTGSY